MQLPRPFRLVGSTVLLAGFTAIVILAPAARAGGQQQASAKVQPASSVTHIPAPPPIAPTTITSGDTQASILSSPLKITLTPSEIPIKLGSNSNIAADIQNLSNMPVMVNPGSIQLMSHAILSTKDSPCVVPLAATTNTYLAGQNVILLPQDHLTVFFNLSERPFTQQEEQSLQADNDAIRDAYQRAQAQAAARLPGQAAALPATYYPAAEYAKLETDQQTFYRQTCAPGMYARFKRAIDFTPGNYEYFISGLFGVCDQANVAACVASRSFAQNATFQVGIDQMAIIVFAILGGLLAYVVVSVRGPDGALSELFCLWTGDGAANGLANVATRRGFMLSLKVLRDVVGVAILAAAFTIVTSRLSDSQFPIKVSVLDGWGAITIGFLSYFVGNKFIDSLHDMVK